jgi:phosphatidylglycerol---prolipoprotein diacylglyceryl transferase
LIFGLALVEIVKRSIGLRTSTGDLYAIPLAIGIAIGRIGCFLTGLSDNTYGKPTSLPWAINFGDGIPRHPTQLYEIVFLLILTPVLFYVLKKIASKKNSVILSGAVTKRSEVAAQSKDPASSAATTGLSRNFQTSPTVPQKAHFLPGDAFKLFMVAYMTFRLLCDFIKPYPRIYLGLGGIQWACALVLLYYVPDIARWLRGQMLQTVRA